MDTIDILNLVIGILSLLATIAISFVIYFLERNNSKKQKAHEIKEAAKRFLVENADERDYLPWAIIAAGCFPQNKHIRRIYNEFTLLDDDVKGEVLRQVGIDIPLIKGNDWINDRIKLIDEAAADLGLGDPFLYDGAKYFHRLYDDKRRKYDSSTFGYYDEVFKDVFGIERPIFLKEKEFVPFTRYIDDYLYFKFEKPNKFSEKWPKPFDYLLARKGIRQTPDEGVVCFWVSVIIEETICYSIRYLGYERNQHFVTDASSETFEDRYFQVLYDLFFLRKSHR